MKIKTLINIIKDKLPRNVVFYPMPSGSKWADITIFKRDGKICFWDEATTHFLIFDDGSKYKESIKGWCNYNFAIACDASLARVMTLAEILYLVEGGSYNTDNVVADYDKYVNKKMLQNMNKIIVGKILKEYNCDQISNMKILVDILKKDLLYRELRFSCTFYECSKDELYKSHKEKIELEFGNCEYSDKDSDLVIITAYNDCVELHHNGTAQSIKKEFRINHALKYATTMSSEDKREQQIIAVLDAWKSRNMN